MSIDPERYVTDLEEQVDSLIRERDDAQSLAAVAREKERAALEERDEALRHLTHAAAVEAALTSDLLAAHQGADVKQIVGTTAWLVGEVWFGLVAALDRALAYFPRRWGG